MRVRRRTSGASSTAPIRTTTPGRALAAISGLLDEHPEFLDWIAADVDRGGPSSKGRAGLSCEVVLRCGILKHLRRMDYRDLEFALLDSDSARRFTRVDPLGPPKRSALQRCIAAVRPATWEEINRVLLGTARRGGIEEGRRVRIDSTVTETHILGAQRQPAPVRRRAGAVAAVGPGSREARPRCLPLPRPPQAGEAQEVEDPEGPGEAQGQAVPRFAGSDAADPRLRGRRARCRRGPRGALAGALARRRRPLPRPRRRRRGPDGAPGARGREGARRGEGGEPVRAPHRHHRQGRAPRPVRPQAEPERRAERSRPSTPWSSRATRPTVPGASR